MTILRDFLYGHGWVHWALRLSLVLLALWVIWSRIGCEIAARRGSRKRDGAIVSAPSFSEQLIGKPNGGAIARTMKEAPRIMALVLAFALGWTWRDHQLATRTMTFRHVRVVAKLSDQRYLMRPAGMKIYDWEFCHAITPPAAVVDIKFEQRNGCKQIIGVGFLEISRQENNYDEIGRNSATATTASF